MADAFKKLLNLLPETIFTDKLLPSILKYSFSANEQDIFHLRECLLQLPLENLSILKRIIQMFVILCATPNMNLNSLSESLGPLLFKCDNKEINYTAPIFRLLMEKKSFFFEGANFHSSSTSSPKDIQEILKENIPENNLPIKFLKPRSSICSIATSSSAISETSSYCDSLDYDNKNPGIHRSESFRVFNFSFNYLLVI